ncbi:MAG: hypothetical protein IT381_11555 [Deltaproteobacteria bacterium]|nr:hypothetical protein [Deltaproteobacteria bacterium]
MAAIVYVLCAATSIGCAILLYGSYRRNRTPLLLASSTCFAGLALNNGLLVVDLILVPNIDFSLVRAATGFLSVAVLLIALIRGGRV